MRSYGTRKSCENTRAAKPDSNDRLMEYGMNWQYKRLNRRFLHADTHDRVFGKPVYEPGLQPLSSLLCVTWAVGPGWYDGAPMALTGWRVFGRATGYESVGDDLDFRACESGVAPDGRASRRSPWRCSQFRVQSVINSGCK
jgi:hypothetical protein